MNITNSTVNIDNLNVYNNTTILSKVCKICNQYKPLTEYGKDKTKSDGLQYMCKSCRCITNKYYRNKNKQNNANKIYNDNDIKTCSQCNQSKPLTEYQKNRLNSDGLRYNCKSCESIATKLYRNNNRQINTNRIYTENDIKTCSTCKQQKLYTEVNKWSSDKSGLDSYCKDCIKMILKKISDIN